MANVRILAGYPCPNEKGGMDLIFDVIGPASYVNSGTFGTSGVQINAADLGMGGFEDVGSDMMSSDGVNVIEIVPGATIAGGTAPTAPQAGQPGPVFKTFVMHWFTSPTRGTEVTNGTPLNTKYVRLRAVCV